MLKGPDDRTLDGRSLPSDTHTFAATIDRHRERLALWIAVRIGPTLRARTSVDDAVQETFLQAIRSRASFRNDAGDGLFRWLTKIAENRLRDFAKYHGAARRHPGREVPLSAGGSSSAGPDRLPADGGTPPAASAAKRELHRMIAEALETMPADQREIIVLHVVEGQSFASLSARLGRPASSLHAVYGRALVELRRRLPLGSTT